MHVAQRLAIGRWVLSGGHIHSCCCTGREVLFVLLVGGRFETGWPHRIARDASDLTVGAVGGEGSSKQSFDMREAAGNQLTGRRARGRWRVEAAGDRPRQGDHRGGAEHVDRGGSGRTLRDNLGDGTVPLIVARLGGRLRPIGDGGEASVAIVRPMGPSRVSVATLRDSISRIPTPRAGRPDGETRWSRARGRRRLVSKLAKMFGKRCEGYRAIKDYPRS